MNTPTTAGVGMPATTDGTIVAPKGLDVETATSEQCSKALQTVMKSVCKGTNLNPAAFTIIDQPDSKFVAIHYTHKGVHLNKSLPATKIMEEFNEHTGMFRSATSTAYDNVKKTGFSLVGQTWLSRQSVAERINSVAHSKDLLAEIDEVLKEKSGFEKS